MLPWLDVLGCVRLLPRSRVLGRVRLLPWSRVLGCERLLHKPCLLAPLPLSPECLIP